MRRWEFLSDQLPYVFAFAAALSLALAVVGLEATLTGRAPSAGSLAYIGALSSACLLAYVLLDYRRRRPFLRRLEKLCEHPSLEGFAALGPAITCEQALVSAAIQEQHRLYQDELAAYRARRELGSAFMQRWAHQMKTPLSVIALSLQEEERTGRCPPDVVAGLREELEKLSAGLELILTNARLDDFRADFVVHRTDIVALARGVINDHRSAFIRRRVYPELKASESSVFVETDEKWVRFVLSQVIGNAIKYSWPVRPGLEPRETEAGASPAPSEEEETPAVKRVIIRVERDCDEGAGGGGGPGAGVRSVVDPDICRISVTDEGIGIPVQDLGRVFDPFFTGENGRLYPEATGMGLYLAREVCERLGHRISVISVPGRGTTVTVTFEVGKTLHSEETLEPSSAP